MKLAVTGCPRNCAEALCKDLGVVAVDGGRWEIYVGGAAGAHIRKGDLLATVDTPDEVMTLTGRFLQYYRENANWLERTYAFVPRIGHREDPGGDRRRRDGHRRRLDARMAKSVAAYRDPWQDGREPVDRGPVPDVAAAAAAPPGAGAMTRASRCSARSTRCQPGRAARSRSTASRSPSSGCGTARCGRSTPCARTAAGRWPTGSPTTQVVVCPLHDHTFDMCTGTEVSGSGMSVRSYPVQDVDGTIRITT